MEKVGSGMNSPGSARMIGNVNLCVLYFFLKKCSFWELRSLTIEPCPDPHSFVSRDLDPDRHRDVKVDPDPY